TAVRNGLSWKFTVTATDAENGIVGYDWYAHGYNKGMADPDSSSRRNTFSYTFNSSDSGKICTLRVEVVDTFKARDYADLILKTDSAVIGLIQGQYTFAEDTSSKDELTATDPLLSPNPFNPGTAIHFGAFANNINPIHMDVFSASGKLVHRLTLPAGTKSAIWNGRDSRGNSVGNGIYLFRIVSGKSVKKIRGILVK
ncbi:MAG: hypothetical protein JNL74_03650, partial [Fibrobacteres bacterium]|nr:hypothetical protein [Fibrobacterota bacterium]